MAPLLVIAADSQPFDQIIISHWREEGYEVQFELVRDDSRSTLRSIESAGDTLGRGRNYASTHSFSTVVIWAEKYRLPMEVRLLLFFSTLSSSIFPSSVPSLHSIHLACPTLQLHQRPSASESILRGPSHSHPSTLVMPTLAYHPTLLSITAATATRLPPASHGPGLLHQERIRHRSRPRDQLGRAPPSTYIFKILLYILPFPPFPPISITRLILLTVEFSTKNASTTIAAIVPYPAINRGSLSCRQPCLNSHRRHRPPAPTKFLSRLLHPL
jgi:hypothetical protein